MIVNEIYGPVFQGEGPRTGRRSVFLRLAKCNLACSWCDTPYTWDTTGKNGVIYTQEAEWHKMEVEQVIACLREYVKQGIVNLIISGGEPLLQRDAVVQVLEAWCWTFRDTTLTPQAEIETAGTLPPLELPRYLNSVVYNVSPKLETSGNPLEKRYKPDILARFVQTGRAAFKFVVSSPEQDFAEIDSIIYTIRNIISREGKGGWLHNEDIWIMPEGTDAETILGRARDLEQEVLKRGWNLTLRQHVLLYGQTRCT